MFSQKKVQVHYVLNDNDTTTAVGIMMAQIANFRSTASSMENSQKTHSHMISNFLRRNPETGWLLKNGGRPQFGYRIIKVKYFDPIKSKMRSHSVWEIDEANNQLFRRIVVDMRVGRNMSYEEIRDELNAEGIPSPDGE
jgi:hypothetical protein